MKIAVVPATYNRPDALAALFEGYLAQDYANFEIIVADDGSGPETREVIQRYKARASFRIDHAWQQNKGYRAAVIRNQAVARTDADYIMLRGVDRRVPRHVLEERGGLLTVLAGRVNGVITITIVAYQPGVENTKPGLRELVTSTLADFGITGVVD